MSRIVFFAAMVCLTASHVLAQNAAPPAASDAAATPAKEAAPATEAAPPAGPAPSPEAKAAFDAFDALLKQWTDVTKQLQDADKERLAATGDARTKLEAQVAELRTQANDILKKTLDAGLAVYKADPKAYPQLNDTLIYVAQFFIAGDPRGDGGDQYEKALPLIKGLIDAGAGETWPQLYLWGALAAYCTNDFDLAEQYFAKAGSGSDGSLPPHLLETTMGYKQDLPAMKRAWEEEKKIRDSEAKADNLPRIKFATTKGDIVIELFENEAPQSVANIITLVKKGFYNGVSFHRVIGGFMAQGGDPQGTGAGGPGYTIRDEHTQPNYRHHFRGSLSMAKTQAPNSGGSQFFLTFVPTSFLNSKHTVFGRVIEGMDVAASLNRGEPPRVADKIIKAEVLRDRGHEYKFDQLPDK